MTDYLVSTQGGNAISPGLHFGIVFGFTGLGLQPGYLPTDLPRVQFALGYRLKDMEAGVQEWWEIYTLSFGEKSNLRKHIMAGGLLNQEEMAKGFDPRKLIGRATGLLFQKVPRQDGTEKSKLLGLSPMKEPPAGVTLDELKAGGRVIFERERPDPAMLARLPGWIQAKVNPQPAAAPGPVYPQSAAPAYAAAFAAPAQPEAAPDFNDDLPDNW
ncbi:MAG: hypothetical protein WAV07_03540 [Candidatus Contendobacter sp.]